jgi:hypothetical protein
MKLGNFDAALLLVPVSCWVIGFALNKICMAVNGGMMPVMWPTGWGAFPSDANHILMTTQTHLNSLGDWINVHVGVASVGDQLIEFYKATWFPFLLGYIARTFNFCGRSDKRS